MQGKKRKSSWALFVPLEGQHSERGLKRQESCSIFTPAPRIRKVIKKARSEEDLRQRHLSVDGFEKVAIGDSPRFAISCSRILPIAVRPYTTQEAQNTALVSHYFRMEHTCVSTKGNTEEVEQKVVSQGILEDIIEWCSFFPGTTLVNNVLLGYRNLVAAKEFFAAIVNQRKKYKTARLLDDSVEERFYAFLLQWILLWESDLQDMYEDVFCFVRLCFKAYHNAVSYINLLLTDSDYRSPGFIALNSHSKIKVRKSLQQRRKVQFIDLLNFKADTLAKQLTMLESNMMSQVSVTDFVGRDWSKRAKQDSSPLKALSDHFNRVSLWTSTAIVLCHGERKQARMYSKFVRLAKKLFYHRNYSSCCQVLVGLEDASVTRLKLIEYIPHDLVLTLEEIKSHLSPIDNYAEYRKIKTIIPCIPLLPVVLRDLTYMYDAMPDYIDEENAVVNLLKLQRIASTIYDVNLWNCCKYTFTINEDCKDVLLFTLAMAQGREEIYEYCLRSHPVRKKRMRRASTCGYNTKSCNSYSE